MTNLFQRYGNGPRRSRHSPTPALPTHHDHLAPHDCRNHRAGVNPGRALVDGAFPDRIPSQRPAGPDENRGPHEAGEASDTARAGHPCGAAGKGTLPRVTAIIPSTTRLNDRVAANLTALFSALEDVTLADQERKAFTNLAFFPEATVVADVIKRVREQC
jgi:hypothetical protein